MPPKGASFQKTMATHTRYIHPCAERLLQSFQTPKRLSSSPSLALGLHKDAAPLPMLVIIFQTAHQLSLAMKICRHYPHCCVQPNNLPSKVILWGQTVPSERPSQVSPVISMRTQHTLVTDCQLVPLLPRDMWSHKGVQAIQAVPSCGLQQVATLTSLTALLLPCQVRTDTLSLQYFPKCFKRQVTLTETPIRARTHFIQFCINTGTRTPLWKS